MFLTRGYLVNLGYNMRQVRRLKSSIHDVLVLLQEHGGDDALAYVRRYMRVDPAVTEMQQQRRTQVMLSNPDHIPWKQFRLF